jgi:hypothetical protein
MRSNRTILQPRVLILQVCVLLLLVFPFVSSAFRDNDQATLLDAAWQVAHGQASFLHATFYNFDKQWGVFLILSWLFRAFPHADPVLAANILLTVIASLAWLTLGVRTGRTKTTPFWLIAPVLLCPVLILYIPFLGTAWFSLAFLLLAFFFWGNEKTNPNRILALFLLFSAGACRGDVVLAVPSLALSLMPRGGVSTLLRQKWTWLLLFAATAPVFVGKFMAGSAIPDTNPLSFDPRSYFGFVSFGLTPAMVALLILAVFTFLAVAVFKRRFAVFYVAFALSPLIPLGFYSLQLYTLRYFFLTVAATLFVVSSPRSLAVVRGLARKYPKRQKSLAIGLVSLTVVPWLLGLNAPTLHHLRPTFSEPTLFPTGDGQFPMGAYLAFSLQSFKENLQIDHNQKIWLSARTAAYKACPDGSVPFLITPMTNFIEFAIRLQHKRALPIDYLSESPCGLAYVDARSIIRGYRPTAQDGPFLDRSAASFVSSTDNGELIVEIDARSTQTIEAAALKQLAQLFPQREVQIFTGSQFQIPIKPGLTYAIFSEQECKMSGPQLQGRNRSGPLTTETWAGTVGEKKERAEVTCASGFSGWAHTVLPPYMGL